MKSKGKNAISLIVLVITILVLSILAATVIISLSNTNIIGETSKTVLKSNLTTMQDIATVYFADNYETIDMEKEYSITEFGITDDEFKDYRDYAFVKAGKVYIKLNAPEDIQEVAKELNMLIDGTSSSTGEVALEKTVKTLRIYGNTESTGSVGEKTKNLFEVTSNTIVNPGAAYASNLVIEKAGFSAAIGSSTIDTSAVTSYKNGYVKLFVPVKEGTFTLSGKYEVINQGEVTDMSNISGKISLYIGGAWYKNFTINLVNGNFTLVYTISDVEQDTTAYFNFPLCGNTVKYYDMQLEEGSAATDYEPYGYKVPVTTVGKNLFDIDNISNVEGSSDYSIQTKNNNIILSGTVYSCSSKKTLKQLCPSLKVGDIVTLSFDTTSSAKHIYLLSSEYVWRLGVTRTITEDDLNSIVYFYNESNLTESNEVIISNIQIEKGTTATAYEAYIGKTYNMYLNEPLRKLGSSVDYIDCTTGEVVRYIGVTSAGELEVLSTPVKESATLEEMNFEGVNHIFVDTTVTPSNIEVKY